MVLTSKDGKMPIRQKQTKNPFRIHIRRNHAKNVKIAHIFHQQFFIKVIPYKTYRRK